MISAFLKEQTKLLHDRTEKKLESQKIFDKTYSVDDYKKLLSLNYKLIDNFELQVAEKLSNYKDLKLALRKKLDFLKTDLDNLKIPMKSEEDKSQPIENEAEAFGILYVIEGSTLGGNVIVRQLRKNPNFQNIEFNYFGAYGEKTGQLWQEFKTVIDNTILDQQYEDCLKGAQKAYQILS